VAGLKPVPDQEIADLIGTALGKIFQTTHPSITDKQLEMVMKDYVETFKNSAYKDTLLFPGIKETLEKLKQADIKMSILSNKPTAAVLPIVKFLGIESYFDYIYGADDVPVLKPANDGILKMLENYPKINKDEVLMVGDTDNDILAAKNAGVKSALVKWGKSKKIQTEPNFAVEAIAEIEF